MPEKISGKKPVENPERMRLAEEHAKGVPWRKCGPYLSAVPDAEEPSHRPFPDRRP